MTNHLWAAAVEATPAPSPGFWQDPSIWANFGFLAFGFYAFFTDKLYSRGDVEEIKAERDVLVGRLLAERNKALADRDEMAAMLQTELMPTVRELFAVTQGLMPAPAVMRKLEDLLPSLQSFMERDNRSRRRTGDGSGSG